MSDFKSFVNASIMISGIELDQRIRKRQFSLGPGRRPHSSLDPQSPDAVYFTSSPLAAVA
jgi:hypothetical protein